MTSVLGAFEVTEIKPDFRKMSVINSLLFSQSVLYEAEQPGTANAPANWKIQKIVNLIFQPCLCSTAELNFTFGKAGFLQNLKPRIPRVPLLSLPVVGRFDGMLRGERQCKQCSSTGKQNMGTLCQPQSWCGRVMRARISSITFPSGQWIIVAKINKEVSTPSLQNPCVSISLMMCNCILPKLQVITSLSWHGKKRLPFWPVFWGIFPYYIKLKAVFAIYNVTCSLMILRIHWDTQKWIGLSCTKYQLYDRPKPHYLPMGKPLQILWLLGESFKGAPTALRVTQSVLMLWFCHGSVTSDQCDGYWYWISDAPKH